MFAQSPEKFAKQNNYWLLDRLCVGGGAVDDDDSRRRWWRWWQRLEPSPLCQLLASVRHLSSERGPGPGCLTAHTQSDRRCQRVAVSERSGSAAICKCKNQEIWSGRNFCGETEKRPQLFAFQNATVSLVTEAEKRVVICVKPVMIVSSICVLSSSPTLSSLSRGFHNS